MSFLKNLKRAATKLIPSPIEVDFKKGGGHSIQSVATYPHEVFWDATVEVFKSTAGVEFVRTPEERFENLPDYDFAPNYLEVDGLRMHYVDEGPKDGEIILMLHGQPTWSFLYRKMIKVFLAKGYRCIAPDLIGMGKSDKPVLQRYHNYDQHCKDMLAFLKQGGWKDITLVCQDWGSLIGMRLVGEHPELFARVVLANGDLPTFTAANNKLYIPNPVVVNPKIGSIKAALAKYAVADGATSFQAWLLYCLTTPKMVCSEIMSMMALRMSAAEKAAYDAPFPSFVYCAGPRTLPSMNAGIRGQTAEAWEGLRKFDKPFLSVIGLDDKLLGRPSIQKRWIEAVPGAKGQDHLQFEGVNHFIQEDMGQILAQKIDTWISKLK